MNSHPAFVIVCLIDSEGVILYLADHPRTSRFFKFIPHIFWIYFLPMLASTAGIINAKDPMFVMISQWVLPMSLMILLMTVDLPSIVRLGPMAIGMFVAGSISVGCGIIVAFLMFKGTIGGEYWSGFGALTGSWTGGSANMIAVKEALSAPDSVFLPLVVVDAVLPYLWMGLLIVGSQWQERFDLWNRVDEQGVVKGLRQRLANVRANASQIKYSVWGFCLVIGIGLAGTLLATKIAASLPVIKGVLSPFTWVIVLVSALGLLCSLTPIKVLERHGSNKIGYFLLYFVLTTIGARADLSQMPEALSLMGAGVIVIIIHALGLFVALRILKAPFFLAAVASQANLGGVASAPVVAEVYQKGLAPLGLLLAILGNIIGTYIGITVGQICRILQ